MVASLTPFAQSGHGSELAGHVSVSPENREPKPHMALHCDEFAQNVVSIVAETMGKTSDEIKGPGQARALTIPRHMAMFILRVGAHWSFPKIAAVFNRDHTSVIHGVRSFADRAERSVDLRLQLQQAEEKLRSLNWAVTDSWSEYQEMGVL